MLLSVIICTHNPRADYFPRVLEALKAQTLPKEQWELLVIDNASKEPLAGKWDLSWHPHTRHIREDELGLTPARLRGIKESTGDLLVFVDDDNVLEKKFFQAAVAVAAERRYLGVFGAAVIEPEFEIQPSDALRPLLPLLALRRTTVATWSNNPHDAATIPWGAGLCVTPDVANEYVGLVERLNITRIIDRNGWQLFSGGDDLFSWTASFSGHGFGIFPELRMTHLIPGRRLTEQYFLRLLEGHRFSHAVLEYLLAGRDPTAGTFLQRSRRVLAGLRRGTFSMRCQLAVTRGSNKATDFITDNALQLPFRTSGLRFL